LNEELISKSSSYTKYKNYDYDLSFNYEAISADTSIIDDVWGMKVVIEDGEIKWDL
jgi:hypothetical protein